MFGLYRNGGAYRLLIIVRKFCLLTSAETINFVITKYEVAFERRASISAGKSIVAASRLSSASCWAQLTCRKWTSDTWLKHFNSPNSHRWLQLMLEPTCRPRINQYWVANCWTLLKMVHPIFMLISYVAIYEKKLIHLALTLTAATNYFANWRTSRNIQQSLPWHSTVAVAHCSFRLLIRLIR